MGYAAHKKCHRCGSVEPLTSFCKDRRTPDKLSYWCAQCRSEHSRQYRSQCKVRNKAVGAPSQDRKCPSCKQVKPASDFHSKPDTPDGIGGYCKICHNIKQTARRESRMQEIRALKEATSCMDCGKSYPYWVMQFDHKPGEKKLFLIGRGVRPRETIMAEIRKCEIVCTNCYATRTHVRTFGKP